MWLRKVSVGAHKSDSLAWNLGIANVRVTLCFGLSGPGTPNWIVAGVDAQDKSGSAVES